MARSGLLLKWTIWLILHQGLIRGAQSPTGDAVSPDWRASEPNPFRKNGNSDENPNGGLKMWTKCSKETTKIIKEDEIFLLLSNFEPEPYTCTQRFTSSGSNSSLFFHCQSIHFRINCHYESLIVKTDSERYKICSCYDGTKDFFSKTIEIQYSRKIFAVHGGYLCSIASVSSKQQKVVEPFCGMSKLQEDQRLRSFVAPRVVRGDDVEKNAFPWMVLLKVYEGDDKHQCGGSLVSNTAVITAAHCLTRDTTKVKVGLGKQNRTQQAEEGSIWMTSTKFIINPNFDAIKLEADIAVIFLPSKITFNDHIRPICLPSNHNLNNGAYIGNEATAIGWGATEYEGPYSEALQKVSLEILDHERCKDLWEGRKVAIQDSQICAVGKGRDTCKGDSGGPLMAQVDDQWMLLGITAYGYECATPGVPGVYTRVHSFLPWVKHMMKLF